MTAMSRWNPSPWICRESRAAPAFGDAWSQREMKLLATE